MTHHMPPPMAMPSLEAIVRGANEECSNALDAQPRYRSVSEEIPLRSGGTATIVCRRSKKGAIAVTIRTKVPQ